MQYGKIFKKYRKDSNLTQKDVAEKLNVMQSSVSDWENDVSRPDYEKLILLAKLYGVTVSELLGEE